LADSKLILLSSRTSTANLRGIVRKHKDLLDTCGYTVDLVCDLIELTAIQAYQSHRLICFNTGVIIPKTILDGLEKTAYNFHAAPPEFSGRDPHHWAINRGATVYGATCHVMTEKVDDGPIVAVSSFDIEPGTNPKALARQAINVAADLFDALLPRLLEGDLPPANFEWGPIKSSRGDSNRMRGKKGFEDF
jgi:folate-dependent phosphoribosylglycinamide formyltransferase PurN